MMEAAHDVKIMRLFLVIINLAPNQTADKEI
jgi:hypothetical protein